MQVFISNWNYSLKLTALVVFTNGKYIIMLSMNISSNKTSNWKFYTCNYQLEKYMIYYYLPFAQDTGNKTVSETFLNIGIYTCIYVCAHTVFYYFFFLFTDLIPVYVPSNSVLVLNSFWSQSIFRFLSQYNSYQFYIYSIAHNLFCGVDIWVDKIYGPKLLWAENVMGWSDPEP